MLVFFFKQKTAYEMRISDWSSDVCSSDLWTSGPQQLQRYDGYPAMTISGMAAPGRSTGEAMDEMERLATALPEGFAYEWTGISFEEKPSGGQIDLLPSLSFFVVLLLLSALYESWPLPISALLVVPLCVLRSVFFTMLCGFLSECF